MHNVVFLCLFLSLLPILIQVLKERFFEHQHYVMYTARHSVIKKNCYVSYHYSVYQQRRAQTFLIISSSSHFPFPDLSSDPAFAPPAFVSRSLRDILVDICLLMLKTHYSLGSSPGINTPCFVRRIIRLIEFLGAIPDVRLET